MPRPCPAPRRCETCRFWLLVLDPKRPGVEGHCEASSPTLTHEPVFHIRIIEQLWTGAIVHNDDTPGGPWHAVVVTPPDHFCACWQAIDGVDADRRG